MTLRQKPAYQKPSLTNILGLASAHTWWPASILPVLFASVLAMQQGFFQLPIFVAVLAISVLMHSAVNTLNDYYDFIKGVDTVANSADPKDAVLVYQRIDPRQIKLVGLSFLALAAILGVYVVWQAGWWPLLLGLLGGLVVLTYSAGKLPLSYLPVGEIVSGLAMGMVLPLAAYASFSGRLWWPIFGYAWPFVLGIGLIMMTNNTCDIERDRLAGRKTLPALLGRASSLPLYRVLIALWLLLTLIITALYFRSGWFVLPLGFLFCFPVIKRLLQAPLTPDRRDMCMPAVLRCNLWVNGLYIVAILVCLARG